MYKELTVRIFENQCDLHVILMKMARWRGSEAKDYNRGLCFARGPGKEPDRRILRYSQPVRSSKLHCALPRNALKFIELSMLPSSSALNRTDSDGDGIGRG